MRKCPGCIPKYFPSPRLARLAHLCYTPPQLGTTQSTPYRNPALIARRGSALNFNQFLLLLGKGGGGGGKSGQSGHLIILHLRNYPNCKPGSPTDLGTKYRNIQADGCPLGARSVSAYNNARSKHEVVAHSTGGFYRCRKARFGKGPARNSGWHFDDFLSELSFVKRHYRKLSKLALPTSSVSNFN